MKKQEIFPYSQKRVIKLTYYLIIIDILSYYIKFRKVYQNNNNRKLLVQKCFSGFNQSKILHYFSDNWHSMLIILVTSQEI